MGRRLLLVFVVLSAFAGCVRVKGLPYRPIRRPEPIVAVSTVSCMRTHGLEADLAAWEAAVPALSGKLALASTRPADPPLAAGTVHVIGAVEAHEAEVAQGGAPIGDVLFRSARPTWEADLARLAVVGRDRAWLVDWWNLSDGSLRGCPFRVGRGDTVVVFPARGHEVELRARFWDVVARQMAARADAPGLARSAAAALCKPLE